MKNIRIYTAPKYKTDKYTEVEPNIYKTLSDAEDSDSYLALEVISDKEAEKVLRKLSGWKQGTTDLTEDLLIIEYNGKRYYKEIDDDDVIFENSNDEPEIIYVSSLMFEQEPEYGENEPSDEQVSQYPLEDILDEFLCECNDFYEEENRNDSVNSYIEFLSTDIENIRKLLSIVGKHVYNKDDGDYVTLVIE